MTLENNVQPEKAIMYKRLRRQNKKNASQEQFTNQISLESKGPGKGSGL